MASSRELIAGRYEIVRPLDRGGMGEVLLARQINLDRLVVVKRVVDVHSEQERQALADEARVAARLHHPNIVNILDVIDRDTEPVVVMELVVGVALRELIDAAPGGLPIDVALAITCDLVRGLAYAHTVRSGELVGLVHRDINPRNVMATFAGATKLIDFGISQWLDTETPGSVSGTRGYMAPEQQRGEPLDGRADQYAAGVTLREMLTGERPGDPPREVTPPELAAIVARMTATDRDARFASCSDVLVALEDFLADHAIAATATHVEKWTTQQFGDRRDLLERDAEPVQRPRPRRVTAETVAARGSDRARRDDAEATREPTPEEQGAMRRRGALSLDQLLRYRAVLYQTYAASFPDSVALAVLARELVESDPVWARPYALLAYLEGRTTPSAREAIAAGLSRADRARDPMGIKMLEAYELAGSGEFEAAHELFVAASDADESDVLAGSNAVQSAVIMHRADEATARTRRLHRYHPELMFGADLGDAFRRQGRAGAAEASAREWVVTAPQNVHAHVELARSAAVAGRMTDAADHARAAMEICGERNDTLPELFDAMIASEQFAIAQRIADGMLVGGALDRARGRYRVAAVATFEGRFAAAYDSVRLAIDEQRPFGYQSELVQCLELARSLAPLVAGPTAHRPFTIELATALDELVGDAAMAAATRYELALADRRGSAPSIDEHLVGLPDGPARDVARRRMLRAAAVADCGSSHKAVAAGFSAFEENTASLVALGLCAMRLDEHDLARRSFERATQTWSSIQSTQNSPYHAVLARFHLASALANLGEREAARDTFGRFTRMWADADRPIPEVAIAKQMVAHI